MASSSGPTRVSSSTSAQSVVASDALRKGCVIYNDDANRAYVLCGPGTVSATNCSFSLAQYENAALPPQLAGKAISVIYGTAGSGGLNVTEG
jgi:hypothetical protein